MKANFRLPFIFSRRCSCELLIIFLLALIAGTNSLASESDNANANTNADTATNKSFKLLVGAGPTITRFLSLSGERAIRTHGALATKVMYRPPSYSFLSFGLGSFAQMGRFAKVKLFADGHKVMGRGNYNNANLFAFLQLYIPNEWMELNHRYENYLWAEVSTGLMTFKFTSDISSERDGFNTHHKITYDTTGFNIGLGMMEKETLDQKHPVYFEVVYKNNRGRKETIVGGSTFEAESLTANHNKNIRENTLIFIFGLKVF